MERLEKFLNKYWIISILFLSIPAVWALFIKGFYGASDDIHMAWLYELDRVLRMGQIPPRFVPDLSFGFGYPLFNFVFPLPFYLGEIIHFLGLSLVDSIKTIFLLSIPFSAIFMYLLLKQFTNKALSLIGAILYIYAPYRAVDIYVRGAIGEIVSFMFLPLVVLSIFKLTESFNKRWIGIGALTLSSLVLSHNITAFMFTPFLIILLVFLFFSISKKTSFFKSSILMIFLTLLISLYFWFPAIVESELLKYDTVFNFTDHFPTIRQLIRPYFGYGASVPGEGDGISFFLGIANLAVLIIGLLISIFKWKNFSSNQKILILWGFTSFLIAVFMMNYRSTFIWNNVPYLPYFQFPWRFLIITTFTIPLLIVGFDNFKFKALLYFLPIIFILVTTFSYFKPQDFLGREDNYFLNRYIPNPIASEEYLKTQEEYLRLPKDTEKRPDQNYPIIFPQDHIKRIDKYNDLKIAFDFDSDEESTVSMNKYFFPGWKAKIDGKDTTIEAGKPFGQVSVLVPKGLHRVEIGFEETDFRKILDFASLASFLVSLVLVVI